MKETFFSVIDRLAVNHIWKKRFFFSVIGSLAFNHIWKQRNYPTVKIKRASGLLCIIGIFYSTSNIKNVGMIINRINVKLN